MESVRIVVRTERRSRFAGSLARRNAAASVLSFLFLASAARGVASAQNLPDSPGTLLLRRPAEAQNPPDDAEAGPGPQSTERPQAAEPGSAHLLPACDPKSARNASPAHDTSPSPAAAQRPCRNENPVQPIITTKQVPPLSSRQKGELAFRDLVDPFNLLTIGGYSGIAVAINPHSAYGPGLEGWGLLTGYSLVEDAQGEFFGTYLISSLAHEDPRYHRLPNAPLKRRLLHALAHTWVSQHDDGTPMPNYSTLLTYPISAELSNLYVPGVPTRLSATTQRVAIGLATDPSGTIVAEFLPDLAKHIHIHVIFIQEILNRVATGGTAPDVE